MSIIGVGEAEHHIPRVLYHYTSQEGLLGILDSRELWASKIHFLNDSAEYKLGLQIAARYLEQRARQTEDREERTRLEILEEELGAVERVNVFVFSLTAEGDLLSQWRAYAGNAGFSIGFDSSKLTKFLRAQAVFELRPCLYDRRLQERAVGDLVDEVLRSKFSTDTGGPHPTQPRTFIVGRPARSFGEALVELAPILKDDSFKEEKEWRLISKPTSVYHERVGFREGRSFPIPHFRMRLPGDQDENPIKQIMVGPTAEMELAKDSLGMLLSSKNLNRVKVMTSHIPLRNW